MIPPLVLEASRLPFVVAGALGRDLPAERGRLGKVVLRLGGVSFEKSGRLTGWGGGCTRGLGELGLEPSRDPDPRVRGFEDKPRPLDVVDGERDGVWVLRVGVDGRETGRHVGEFRLPGVCGLELGVKGLVV